MLSIGGITYTDDWNTALAATRPIRPQRRASPSSSAWASRSTTKLQLPNLTAADLHHTYGRSCPRRDRREPGGPLTSTSPRRPVAHRAHQKATADWLRTPPRSRLRQRDGPVQQPVGVDRESTGRTPGRQVQLQPADPAAAPAKFTGTSTSRSKARSDRSAPTSAPRCRTPPELAAGRGPGRAGTTGDARATCSGAEKRPPRVPPRRRTPPGGVGVGATTYQIPIPMPALRSHEETPPLTAAAAPCCWPSVSVGCVADRPRPRTPRQAVR